MRIPCLLMCGLAFGTGCAGGVGEVTGTVTQGGKPLPGATVVLAPDPPGPGRHAATAVTGADGTFTARTHKPGGETLGGVEAGSYRVTVSKLIPPNGLSEAEYLKTIAESGGGVYSPDASPPSRVESVPPEFSDSAKTRLRVEVTPSAGKPLRVEIP